MSVLPSPDFCALDIHHLASRLLLSHGLFDWSFRFNRRRRSMGYCWFNSRTIELSIHFVQRNGLDAIRETLLHEIAHALVGPGHGHDAVWQAKARELGCRPERCGVADMPSGPWQARCGCCGTLHHRFRRPKRLIGWYCRRCGVERGSLVWARP